MLKSLFSLFRKRRRPQPRNPLPCTYVGDHPTDGYSGTEDTWREWTAFDRPYAVNYLLDGWRIDASPETYFGQRNNPSAWAFSNGSAGSVVVVTRELPFDPPIADIYHIGLKVWGLTTCPRCVKPLRFYGSKLPSGSPYCIVEHCDCENGTLPQLTISNLFFSATEGGFIIATRADRMSYGFHAPGPWYLPSTRIDGIHVFVGEDTSEKYDQFQEARAVTERFPPSATPISALATDAPKDNAQEASADIISLVPDITSFVRQQWESVHNDPDMKLQNDEYERIFRALAQLPIQSTASLPSRANETESKSACAAVAGMTFNLGQTNAHGSHRTIELVSDGLLRIHAEIYDYRIARTATNEFRVWLEY